MKSAISPIWARRFAVRYLQAIGVTDDDVALQAIRKRDWVTYLNLKCDPRGFDDPVAYFRAISARAILKKFEGLPTGIDTASVAKQTWYACEKSNYLANLRLAPYLRQHSHAADRVDGIAEFFSRVRKTIRGWLGPAPDTSCLTTLDFGRFGPGTTLTDRGTPTVLDKLSTTPSFTPGAAPFLLNWRKTLWAASVAACQGQSDPEVAPVRGNRFSTVPKTGLTDRCIGIEPSINVFYQLGLGRLIRDRLRRRARWDLNSAADIHRLVARDASVCPTYATLDMSNASDTLCRTLVEVLLPYDWYSLLASLRSPTTEVDGRVVVLEKFSSMGNGYTFELETLIFAALTATILRDRGGQGQLGWDLYVFGDDIILPDDVVTDVVSVLKFCGFTLNDQKSFSGDVPFRESCGADFLNGNPVRPLYLKQEPYEPTDYIAIANRVRTVGKAVSSFGLELDESARLFVLSGLPLVLLRCRGPEGLGDAVIHDEVDQWHCRRRDDIRLFRAVLPGRPRVRPFAEYLPETVLASAVYGAGGSNVGGLIPRQTLRGYRLSWVPYS